MPITSWTAYTNHPRIHCRDTDLTGGLNIRGMSNNSAQWQSVWDTYIVGYSNQAIAKADATLAAEDTLDSKFFTLGLCGWVDTNTSYHNKLKSAALYLANNSSLWAGWNDRREQVMGLAYAYDFLRTGVITFSDTDRKGIGDALIAMCTEDYVEATEDFMDGHKAGNLMAQAIAAVALAGESGSGFNYTTSASDLLTTSFGYWFGSAAGMNNHIESVRYFQGDGGSAKGTWYQAIDGMHVMWLFNAIKNGFSAIAEDTVAFDPWEEDNVKKIGEWWLRAYCRGDLDYLSIGDCARTYTNPFLQEEARRTLAILIRRGGVWRKHVRWMRDLIHTKSNTSPHSVTNYSMGFDVALYDPADSSNASLAPALANPPLAKGRLFDPPGEFIYDSSMDFQQGCKIHISCQEFAPTNHQHLANGGIQIWLKNDNVLAFTGRYSTSDTEANFGGTHHRDWLQQSISHSGVPLVDQPLLTHKSRNLSGSLVDFPVALGGQVWKKYNPGTGLIYDPLTATNLRNQGSKNAWRRSGTNAAGDNKFRIVTTNAGVYWFLHANFTNAYVQQYTDPNSRVSRAEMKILIIENVTSWPIILRLTRMTTTISAYQKRDHWHTYKQPSLSTPQADTLRATASGMNNVGKLTLDVYNQPGFNMSVVPIGTIGGSGYGSTQFSYNGANYPPTNGANVRQEPDIGKYRVEVTPTVSRFDDWTLTLLFPTGALENPPAYTWIDETDWLGVNFSGKEFRIHRTDIQASTNADTVPPDAPTGVVATKGAGSGVLLVNWNLNSETDIKDYVAEYRLKS